MNITPFWRNYFFPSCAWRGAWASEKKQGLITAPVPSKNCANSPTTWNQHDQGRCWTSKNCANSPSTWIRAGVTRSTLFSIYFHLGIAVLSHIYIILVLTQQHGLARWPDSQKLKPTLSERSSIFIIIAVQDADHLSIWNVTTFSPAQPMARTMRATCRYYATTATTKRMALPTSRNSLHANRNLTCERFSKIAQHTATILMNAGGLARWY